MAGLGEKRAVFISHASKADGELALRLAEALERRGFLCWVAPRDLLPSESWAGGCMRGIYDSQSFLLLASVAGLESYNVRDEILQARKVERLIYTILMPPAKVVGEVDFYLARFHWLTYLGRNAEELSIVLAPVLSGKHDWEEIAEGPSFTRTMRYRPTAFGKMVASVAGPLLVVIGVASFALNFALDRDYRSVGWVTLSHSVEVHEGKAELHAQVWLVAKGATFRDVNWVVTSRSGERRFSGWTVPEQVGDTKAEVVIINAPAAGALEKIWSCLIVVRNKKAWRVTQEFALRRTEGEFQIAELSEKRVKKEDGSACGQAGTK